MLALTVIVVLGLHGVHLYLSQKQALTEVMRLLNDFANSEEGTDFFLGLGAAIGDVIKWVPTLVENFETLVKVIKLLIVIPIAKWVGGMAMGFGESSMASSVVRSPLCETSTSMPVSFIALMI